MFKPHFEGEIHYLINDIPYCSLEQAKNDANGQIIKVLEYYSKIGKNPNDNIEFMEFKSITIYNNLSK